MTHTLFDSELKVMELIWTNEPISAKDISFLAEKQIGWNKNTTYTVIKKLETKGFILRTDPGFICTSAISKEEVCKTEAKTLVDKLFGSSRKALFSALLKDEALSQEEIDDLRNLIEKR